ncbi:MAG: DUF262 domain-containing HNH endonuclease family protein [Terracidiphilus sp.]|jgi:hypothetical protein
MPTAATALKETFKPDKRTLGQLLASTSPPLRVPDYQRDFSWEKTQVAEFWDDLLKFSQNDGHSHREYFLGAIVLVNSETFHLVLDGQQRLATATILLAVIRDKMVEYKETAARQIQDQFILFADEITGATVPRLELNVFDRQFFRQFIQGYPRPENLPAAGQGSHRLIVQAYNYFSDRITELWNSAGAGKEGFDQIGYLSVVLRERMALISAIADTERSAAAIFTSLNDRGIGLSSVDLVRSHILQNAHESQREEIIKLWESTFRACGRDIGAESLMRMSWVAQHGDLKSRALYKIITDDLDQQDQASASLVYSKRLAEDATHYRTIRDGDTDDPDLEEYWLSLRILKFNAGYPVFIAAARKFDLESQKRLGKALRTLVLRHNVICNMDRASLESLAFVCSKLIADGGSIDHAEDLLRTKSPSNAAFVESFGNLSFGPSEHGIARYLLTLFDSAMSATAEVTVAGANRVHVEHIYPQQPPAAERWPEHGKYVQRLGNLTLLDRRLNTQIKNSGFSTKVKYYAESKLEVTKELLSFAEWTPQTVEERQAKLLERALKLWSENLSD